MKNFHFNEERKFAQDPSDPWSISSSQPELRILQLIHPTQKNKNQSDITNILY